jgi:hypothetical protein
VAAAVLAVAGAVAVLTIVPNGDRTAAPPNTEVRAPVTLSLSCPPLSDGGRWLVRCEWSTSTAGDVTDYRVLRSVDGQATGRVFQVGPDATTYVDTTVERGVAYRYVVRAERAGGSAAETSPLVLVTWPAESPTSTTTSTTRA